MSIGKYGRFIKYLFYGLARAQANEIFKHFKGKIPCLKDVLSLVKSLYIILRFHPCTFLSS